MTPRRFVPLDELPPGLFSGEEIARMRAGGVLKVPLATVVSHLQKSQFNAGQVAAMSDGKPDPIEALKKVEDQVREEMDARGVLYQLVAYKYLHARGLRTSVIDAEICKELAK